MEKKDLKKLIDEVSAKIKSNSKDSHFAETLIDKLLSLKGQSDVEPTRVHVAESEVLKEYDFDSVRYVRCKTCIIFKAKGGLETIVYPTMQGLYLHLNVILDMKDDYDNLDEEKKKACDTLIDTTSYILSTPTFATISDKMFFGISDDILKRFQSYIEESKKAELQDETPIENANFNDMNEMLDSEKK